jgi:hypothetical protein
VPLLSAAGSASITLLSDTDLSGFRRRRKEFAQLLHRWEITRGQGVGDFNKDDAVVVVGEEIAVVEHVDPNLAIGQDAGRGPLTDYFARRYRGDAQS